MPYLIKCCGVTIANKPPIGLWCSHGVAEVIEVETAAVIATGATCPHLGSKTGRVIRLKGCRNLGRRLVVVHQCTLHGVECVSHRNYKWKGRTCQVCRYQGEDA